MTKKERLIIQKMIFYAEESTRYTKSITYEDFVGDNKTAVYTAFHLLQMGELISKLDDTFKNSNPQIAWGAIKGLRNKIVHHYEGISFSLVWDILNEDIPKLITELKKFDGNNSREE